MHCTDGRARLRATNTPGVALEATRRRKERRSELVGPRARSRLVVFGVEIGSRWPRESQDFITGTMGTADPPTSGRTGLANPLGFHGVLCGGSNGGFVVGPPSGSGS